MVVVYIGDILVTGRTEREHLENLSRVFSRLQDYGLGLKKEKCFCVHGFMCGGPALTRVSSRPCVVVQLVRV